MRAAVLILSLLIPAAWGASASAQPAPAAEFEITVRKVDFHTRHDFTSRTGYPCWSDTHGTDILPHFQIRPLDGTPILGAEPRVRLTAMLSDDGRDLLRAGARALVGDAYSGERPRFLFGDSGGSLPSSACYGAVMEPQTFTIAVPTLPTALRTIEGELTMLVVTDDATAEFVVGDKPEEHTLAPGVRMRIDPRGGFNGQTTATYTVDPSLANGPRPLLNFAMYSCGNTRDLIPFKPSAGPGGRRTGQATFFLQGLDYGKATIFAHMVSSYRTVTMPFRLDNVPITGFTPPAGSPDPAREPVAAEFATQLDGYDVRLLRLAAGGTRVLKGGGEYPPAVQLRVGVLDIGGTRTFGRYVVCTIEEIRDEFGRPVGNIRAARSEDDRGTGGALRFLPRPALPVNGSSYTEAGKGRTINVNIPFDTLPPRLGVLRGRLEFVEATDSFIAEADLTPSKAPVQLGPGVRLVVNEPTPMPNVLPTQPPSDWVSIWVDLPPGTPTKLDESSVPRVNLVQFYNADGSPQHPEYSFGFRRVGNRLQYPIGQVAFLQKAARVRVQVITSAIKKTLPFEFKNVPCATR